MKVAVGGTFDPIHDGHRALLRKALELGDEGAVVGLTSDELAPKTRPKPREIRPFEERRNDLINELESLDEWGRDFRVERLEDPYGVASEDPEFDALVVSPETEEGGDRINEIRQERGYDSLDVVVVPHVMADDGEPISSTRVVEGVIDERGNVLRDTDADT